MSSIQPENPRTQALVMALAKAGLAPPPVGPPGVGPYPTTTERSSSGNTTVAGSVTSKDSGGDLDHLRTAIQALQMYAEGNHDDGELAKVHKCILAIQSILADHASDRDAAMGVTPAMRPHPPRQPSEPRLLIRSV